MSTRREIRNVFIAFAAALLLTLLYFFINKKPSESIQVLSVRAPEHAKATESPPSNRPTQTSKESDKHKGEHSRREALAAIHRKLVSGLASDNPYATAVELRNSGIVGSFAAAHYISEECRRAYKASKVALSFGLGTPQEVRPPGWASGVAKFSASDNALRNNYSQLILARCQPFMDDLAISTPLPNDTEGRAYIDAWNTAKLMDASSSAQQRAEVFAEMARQGMLINDDAIIMLAVSSSYQGRVFIGKEHAIFEAAIALARYQMTMDASSGNNSLQSLTMCLKLGACSTGNDPEKALLALWPGNLEGIDMPQTGALAQKMKYSISNGAIQDFLKKPGG